MDIVFDGLTHRLLRCLKQGSNINIEADISKSGSDYLRSPIVTILTHFSNHNSWTTSF